MISRQPSAIRTIASASYDAELATLADASRITLVGTGTSLHAAQLGAFLFRRDGRDADAISSLDAARWSAPRRPGEALIVISHTGETAYAQRVRAAALAAEAPLVTITGPAAGWSEAIVTPVREASETYTVSYTAALAVLARLAGGLTSGDPSTARLESVADRLDEVISAGDAPSVPPTARAIAFFGSGPYAVTAREGALKTREAARMLAEGFDSELLLHGSAVPFDSRDAFVAVQPAVDLDGLSAQLLAAAAAEGIAVAAVEESDPDPFYAQFALTVRLQLIAARLADSRGHDADTAIVGAWADPALWLAGSPAGE